jgi:hypothetical protein
MKRSAPLQRGTPLRSKPKAWTKPERAPVLVLPAVKQKPRAVMALCIGAGVAQPKAETVRNASWLGAVRSLPACVRCGAHGVEPAHRNEGKGGAIKAHDCWVAALCRPCHREIDQGRGLTREERRAEIDRAIVLTLAQLVLAGKVAVIR